MRLQTVLAAALVPGLFFSCSDSRAQGGGRNESRRSDGPATKPASAPAKQAEQGAKVTNGPVELRLKVAAKDGKKVATLEVTLQPGYHVYVPGTEEGIPISVEIAPGSGAEAAGQPKFPAGKGGHLTGTFNVEIPFKATAKELEVVFGYQACDEQVCFPPVNGIKVRCKLD